MANGTYANAGIDLSPFDSQVDSVTSGPLFITKTADGGGSDTDPLVLDPGDSFTLAQFPMVTFTYVGTDGSGGVLAIASGSSDVLWLSDSTITAGDTVPAAQSSNSTICFDPGTLITTPDGETPVEALQIGDLVTIAEGRAVPVKWIGRQTLHRIFAGERACPVEIAAGALGDGLPHSDLVLTADHALIIDGLAINAGALVNGTTITMTPLSALPDKVTYYHIETDNHDVILANGTPAETYLDCIARQSFDNYADYVARYGQTNPKPEMPYQRITSARLVPQDIRQRLAPRKTA